MVDKHEFCRAMLKEARAEAKKLKIDVPKGLVTTTTIMPRGRWIDVFKSGEQLPVKSEIECCANMAKANYILGLLPE